MESAHTGSLPAIALFVALFTTAVCLGPALAHLFELPNKMELDRDSYFTVQAIYRGWNLFAFGLLVQFASIAAFIVLSRRTGELLWPALIALLGLIAAQALFWIYTFPANQATANWTTIPGNWEMLRRRWEYSHAAGAVFQLITLAALIVAALRYRPL